MLTERRIGGLGTTRENRLQNAAVASKQTILKQIVAHTIVLWTGAPAEGGHLPPWKLRCQEFFMFKFAK